jgi:putative ABC transport system permease protein
MTLLRHHLIWSWRTLAADPWTTLLNLCALSLGLVSFALAAAAALFLRSNDATLPNAERLYAVSQQMFNADGTTLFGRLPMTSSPAAGYIEADYPEIEAVTLLVGGGLVQTVVKGKNHQLAPLFFDDSFARLFKLPLRFGDPDHAFAQPRAVILTSDTSERLYGDSDPVGQTLRLGALDVTIAGVLAPLPPPSIFRSTPGNQIDLLASRDVRDLIAPLRTEPDAWNDYAGYTMILLPKGQSPDRLKAKLAEFGSRHILHSKLTYTFDLVPLTDVRQVLLDGFLGADKTGLSVPQLLLALGGLVLFVASLNYANLAAAKAIGRLPESGMKKVLGAGRGDLMAHSLTESLVLSIAALALVLMLLAGVAGPFHRASGIDVSQLLFHRPTFALELLAGVTTATLAGGLYPAWLLSGTRAIAAALSGKVRPVRSRFASSLVGLQFLTASALLIMIAIVARQNERLDRMATSLGGAELLAIDTALDGQTIGPNDVRNALRDIPGVLAVGGSNALPWSIGPESRRYFRDAEAQGQAFQGTDFEVTEDYFATLGSHLLAGREFSSDRGGDLKPDDDAPDASFNVVVDRDFAEALSWSPEQAVGQTIWRNSPKGGAAPVQIVGVIETQPQVMLAYGASGAVYTLMPKNAVLPLVRLAPGSGPETLAAIDGALSRLAPNIDWHHHFSDELYRDASTTLTAVFAALSVLAFFAVVIALLGLAGMAVHTTSSRTEEIGIRKILGADHLTLMRLLLWDLTKPVLIASLAAWPLGYIAGRIYLSLFIGHATLGPWPFVISLAATMGIAWLAVGWRIAAASAKSPADILRYP